jgi:universal stress protein A
MSYKRILCAIDLSEESREVLDKAKAMAERDGAELSLVTVIKPITHVYGGLDMSPIANARVSFEQEAMDQARQQLAALAKQYGVGAKGAHVGLGAPAHEIRDRAEAINADLIVIGTHGRHGLGLLLGSTANGVLHGVRRDVLVVRVSDDESRD